MGLTPYGEPKFVQALRDHVVQIYEDGSIRLNLEYFEFVHGLTMTGSYLPPYEDAMHGALLGPAYSDDEISAWLRASHVEGERLDRRELPVRIAELIAAGNVVGLFQLLITRMQLKNFNLAIFTRPEPI